MPAAASFCCQAGCVGLGMAGEKSDLGRRLGGGNSDSLSLCRPVELFMVIKMLYIHDAQ